VKLHKLASKAKRCLNRTFIPSRSYQTSCIEEIVIKIVTRILNFTGTRINQLQKNNKCLLHVSEKYLIVKADKLRLLLIQIKFIINPFAGDVSNLAPFFSFLRFPLFLQQETSFNL
jgi:hypothetical protein